MEKLGMLVKKSPSLSENMELIFPDSLSEGVWRSLFGHALTLIDEMERHGTSNPIRNISDTSILVFMRQRPISPANMKKALNLSSLFCQKVRSILLYLKT